MVSLITLNHRWQGDMVGPVGDAAAGLIRFPQSEPPPENRQRLPTGPPTAFGVPAREWPRPIPNTSQAPTLHRCLALFIDDFPGIRW